MNRTVLAAVLVALSLLAVATVGVAAQSDGAAGNVTRTTGNYSIGELRDGGTELENGPASQRFMGEYGSATIRHTPVGPLQTAWKYLEPGTTVHANTVTIRTVRLEKPANLDRTLNVTVVAWERGTREVSASNGTVERPAAVNQSVVRQQITLGRGYDEAQLRLPADFDRTRTVTMWIEEYPTTRWKFQHRSVPSTASVEISSLGELWNWSARNVFLPAGFFVVIAFGLGRETLRRAFSGPDYGLVIWGIITVVLGVAVLSSLYFQVSVVLNYFPWMFGAVLGVLAYGLSLRVGRGKIKVQLLKPHLSTPRSGPRGGGSNGQAIADGGATVAADADADGEPHDPGSTLEEIRELLLVSVGHLPAKRGPDGRIGVPKKGIRPFLARLFADPAILDKEDLLTKIEVEELDLDVPKTGIDEMILLDPESEGVEHIAASLKPRWPVWHRIDPETADWSTKLMGMAGALLFVVGLPVAGYMIGAQFGVPTLVGAAMILPALVEGHGAHDGDVKFEAANQHFEHAWATLIDLQRAQADGKTVKEAFEDADRQRARTAQEALERAEQHDATISTEMIQEVVGVDLEDPLLGRDDNGEDPTPEAGGEEEDE